LVHVDILLGPGLNEFRGRAAVAKNVTHPGALGVLTDVLPRYPPKRATEPTKHIREGETAFRKGGFANGY
jgi:hypothetical protein